MKQRILIFYDHFYPSYKAGGPTQSLVNLVRELYEVYDFYVVCKPHEMGDVGLLNGITADHWNEWEGRAKVFYWHYSWSTKNTLQKLIKDISPDAVYVNGLYSLYFNFLPLYYAKQLKSELGQLTIVLSARGMLHPGALSQKAIKKKIYLLLFRLLGIPEMVTWHATDDNERNFIKLTMGDKMRITVAANFPNLQPISARPHKQPGKLLLGTIALISPMKNHLEVLRSLTKAKGSIEWHIFGPVKDDTYWKNCEAMIQQLPSNIKVIYHGELPPHLLTKAMEQFQVFIMPSKSENFGHAIVEALSAGKPVITTTTTPFADLEVFGCGFAITPEKLSEGLQEAIGKFAAMDESEFNNVAASTQKYIDQKIEKSSLKKAYYSLFNNRAHL
ncbi:glycosyltransferase family 4 protein [Lacibacter sp. H375]|uniref:glycosyltransferase family 4 protein n=1 Tax=Lacibacter sp. H375 TaxID=3133424 RepID=UPI0030C2BC1C